MKYILIVVMSFIAISMHAQIVEGEIIYEVKRDQHRNIPEERSALKERIPQFRTSNYTLFFNSKESLYKRKKKTEAEKSAAPPPGERRGRRGKRRGGGNTIVYKELSNNTTTESTDFFGKKFLIEGSVKSYNWKMTGETKQVGDYLCQKASFQDSTTNVYVWFSPMIPVATGPQNYTGLPGMVLYVNINEGETIITATDVINRTLDDGQIVKPKEGKSMTREDFEKLRREKMEEMKEEFGNRGGRFGRRRF